MRHQSTVEGIVLSVLMVAVPATQSFAYGDNNGRGVKAVSLANSFVSLADNVWTVQYNPAGVAELRSFQVSAFFVPQQFGLPELRTVALAAAIPNDIVPVGLEIEQFGFELYKESLLRFAIGSNLDRSISWGLTANVARIVIERYGATRTVTLDVGLLARPHGDIKLGFAVQNILGNKISSATERLPQVFLFGANVRVVADVLLVVEMEKDVRYPSIVKGGIEKSLFDFVMLRAGISNNPDKFSLGIGLTYSQIEFGYAGYSHVDLGWTHQIEVGFLFNQ
jgi:hypothetical protein